jgi:hypothetical protein
MNCLKIHQKSKLFYLISKFLYALKIGLEVNFYESGSELKNLMQ